jgi:hypothetical protein
VVLLLGQLPQVEVQLLSFEDVPVSASALSRAARDASVQTSNGHLVIEGLVELTVLVPLPKLALDVVALLLLSSLRGGSILLHTDLETVVLLVPLLERSSIYGNNSILDQGLGTDQLVVGGVVHNVQDTGLTGGGLGSPGEVAGIETEGAELRVPSANTHAPHAHVGRELGVGSDTSELILPLLPPFILLSSGRATLVKRITGDTYMKYDTSGRSERVESESRAAARGRRGRPSIGICDCSVGRRRTTGDAGHGFFERQNAQSGK